MKVKGKALMLRIASRTIALATSCSFDATMNTLDARTKKSAGAEDVPDYVSWNIATDSLLGINPGTTQLTYNMLLPLFLQGASVGVELMLAANAGQGVFGNDWVAGPAVSKGFIPCTGNAIIKSLSLSGEVDGYAKIRIMMQGQGALEVVETAAVEAYVDGTTLYVSGPAESVGGSLILENGEVINNTLDI